MPKIAYLIQLVSWLEGTCNSIDQALEVFDLGEEHREALEEALSIANLEKCEACGWWFDSGELVPEEDEPEELTGNCPDCRMEMRGEGSARYCRPPHLDIEDDD